MRSSGYIKVLSAVILAVAASACVKSGIEYETPSYEISIAPVTSSAVKSVPGPVFGIGLPHEETIGIIADHNPDYDAGEGWDDVSKAQPYIRSEFGYVSQFGAWGGITSRFENGEKVTERNTYEWPSAGSLIFAGFSPYYKFDHNDPDNLIPLREKYGLSFNRETRTLTITGYSVGHYVPITMEDMLDPDYEYENKTQSDLMFFMPNVVDGKYIGVNRVNAYPAYFHHALSLVEFTVSAEDEYTMDNVDIASITLESVCHTGNFSARVEDNGSITAQWADLQAAEDVHVLGNSDTNTLGPESDEYFYLDMDPRSVAQLLVIPGPTHRVKVVCHVYVEGKMYKQTYLVNPEDVGIDKWEMGKRYVYNLILGINRISFSPETYEWVDVAGDGTAARDVLNNK